MVPRQCSCSQIIAFRNARFNWIQSNLKNCQARIWAVKESNLLQTFCMAGNFGQTPEATWARARSIPPAASSGSCNFLMTMRHKIQLWCKQNQQYTYNIYIYIYIWILYEYIHRTFKSWAQAVPVVSAFVLLSHCVQDVPTHAKVLVEG